MRLGTQPEATALCLTHRDSFHNETATLGCTDCTHLYNRDASLQDDGANKMLHELQQQALAKIMRRYGCCRCVAQPSSHVYSGQVAIAVQACSSYNGGAMCHRRHQDFLLAAASPSSLAMRNEGPVLLRPSSPYMSTAYCLTLGFCPSFLFDYREYNILPVAAANPAHVIRTCRHLQVLLAIFCMPNPQAEVKDSAHHEKADHSLVRECAAFYFCQVI